MINPLSLQDRVALITGASSGIGAATAMLFADLGARVAVHYNSNLSGAEDVCHEIVAKGGTAEVFQADVTKSGEIERLIDDTRKAFGAIDILVNNAGSLVERLPIAQVTEERWDAVMDLNLRSAAICTHAVVGSMMERKAGSIINIGSIAGRNGGGPGAGPYSVAKGGLMVLTKSLAKQLAPHGIRVNCVAPGVIDTPFHTVFSTKAMMEGFIRSIPLGRVGTPVECAYAIAFLASDAAAYIVGATIDVNGGQLMA